MEYVEGLPIDAFCEQNKLSLKERIQLFLKVAKGIQHAHQRGIIHRDIKPSNVLVKKTVDGFQPKIIDFGIAKAFEGDLAKEETLTQQQAIIGSLDYMSPEQLQSEPIDIRTDVFALAMLLYKILVGRLPYEPDTAGGVSSFFERINVYKEGVPRLSTCYSNNQETAADVAANRQITQKSLYQKLRDDLDWVVLKGLAYDRDQRFSSVSDLISDLERFLKGEPLLVRPPSMTYQLGKFARRHKTKTFAGLFSLVAVLTGTILATVGLLRAQRAEIKSNLEADKAQAINVFMEEMLWSADPHLKGKDIKVVDVLHDAAAKLETSFIDQPEVRVSLYTTIGKTFHQLGNNEKAVELLKQGIEEGKTALGVNHLETIEAEVELGESLGGLGKHEEDLAINQQVIKKMRAMQQTEHPLYFQALNNAAASFFYLGRDRESGGLHDPVLRGAQALIWPLSTQKRLGRRAILSS